MSPKKVLKESQKKGLDESQEKFMMQFLPGGISEELLGNPLEKLL